MLGPADSSAMDVNDAGVVVGAGGEVAHVRPFLYDSHTGRCLVLDPLPGHATAGATAVNAAGHVTGTSRASGGEDRAFLYDGARMLDLGPALWAADLNDSDTVVGSRFFTAAPAQTAFRLRPGSTFENIGLTPVAGYGGSYGNAINNASVVVGQSFPKPGSTLPSRAFVHFPSGPEAGFHDLADLTVGAEGWTLEEANDINNLGVIVGRGRFQGLMRAFRLDPVEP